MYLVTGDLLATSYQQKGRGPPAMVWCQAAVMRDNSYAGGEGVHAALPRDVACSSAWWVEC